MQASDLTLYRQRIKQPQEVIAEILGVPLSTYQSFELGSIAIPEAASKTMFELLARYPGSVDLAKPKIEAFFKFKTEYKAMHGIEPSGVHRIVYQALGHTLSWTIDFTPLYPELDSHINNQIRTDKSIHPLLIRAYREAKFVVETSSPITLFIGKSNRDLSIVLQEHGVTTAAFITAHNPYSQPLDETVNAKVQSQLTKDVESTGYKFIKGYGQDIEEKWTREESILILGINETEAEKLSDKYQQNAFVWIGSIDAYVSLRLRRPIQVPSNEEMETWIAGLTKEQQTEVRKLSTLEQAWLLTASDEEQVHWLSPGAWDLNKNWPLAKPDGSAMGIGTELDRMFKIIAAGQSQIF